MKTAYRRHERDFLVYRDANDTEPVRISNVPNKSAAMKRAGETHRLGFGVRAVEVRK